MDSGTPSNTLWAYYDPDSSSLRTSAPSLLDDLGWMSSSVDLPRSGSMRSGSVFEHRTSAPRTVGSGGSYLPTPRANKWGPPDSHGHVPEPLLPTPCAQEPGGTLEDYHRRLREARPSATPTFVPLGMVAQLLPTPTVGDAANAANRTAGRSNPDSKHHDGTTLVDATRLLPTPTSRDWEGENQRRDETCLPGAVRGATTGPPSPDGNTPSDGPPRLPLTDEDDSLPGSSSS